MTQYSGDERRAPCDLTYMRETLADAIVIALKRTAHDQDFARSFWRTGYVELSAHAGNGASQWIGKKLAVWAATAIVGSLLIWLVKTGAIK